MKEISVKHYRKHRKKHGTLEIISSLATPIAPNVLKCQTVLLTQSCSHTPMAMTVLNLCHLPAVRAHDCAGQYQVFSECNTLLY